MSTAAVKGAAGLSSKMVKTRMAEEITGGHPCTEAVPELIPETNRKIDELAAKAA